jgi:hypothetical protein
MKSKSSNHNGTKHIRRKEKKRYTKQRFEKLGKKSDRKFLNCWILKLNTLSTRLSLGCIALFLLALCGRRLGLLLHLGDGTLALALGQLGRCRVKIVTVLMTSHTKNENYVVESQTTMNNKSKAIKKDIPIGAGNIGIGALHEVGGGAFGIQRAARHVRQAQCWRVLLRRLFGKSFPTTLSSLGVIVKLHDMLGTNRLRAQKRGLGAQLKINAVCRCKGL